MTSQGPYLPEYNATYKYDSESCPTNPVTVQKITQNTLLGFLQNHPDFTVFYYLAQRANMSGLFNSDQVYITLLAVSDTFIKKNYPENVFLNMDISTARKILQNHILERNISIDMLESSNGLFLKTRGGNRLLYQRDHKDEMTINHNIELSKQSIKTDNAIILFVDNIIMPDDVMCNPQVHPTC